MSGSIPNLGIFAALQSGKCREKVPSFGRNRVVPGVLGVVSIRFHQLHRRRRNKALRASGGDHE